MSHHPISRAKKREQQTQQQWIQQVAGNPRWGKIYKQNSATARTSTFNSARVTAQRRETLQLETEVIQRPRICKELATKYYSYTANEADEEREHRLPL